MSDLHSMSKKNFRETQNESKKIFRLQHKLFIYIYYDSNNNIFRSLRSIHIGKRKNNFEPISDTECVGHFYRQFRYHK